MNTADLTTLDLKDPAHFADGPPHDLFTTLRAQAPVHWNAPSDDDDGFWSLTRHEDDVMVSKDWGTFSSARRGIFIRGEGILPKEFLKLVFSNMDPPEHDKHRGILQKVFTSRAVTSRSADIRATVGRLIDDVIERGECDFVTDIGAALPLIVTSNMLGVPVADQDKLFGWTNQMADVEVTADDKIAMMGEMAQYVLALVGERRERPTEDLLSHLIHADLDGEQLNDLELVVNFAQLMAGGNETTRNAFAGGVLALIEHPDERQKLLDDPALIPNAVEEILRWHTPIMHNLRTATRDTVIRGVQIEEGQRVALWHVSGNRDEDVYEDPQAFRVDRHQVRHLSFNGGGKHFCIGNQLARLELRICLEETLGRLPDMQLAGPVRRKPSHNFHWMQSMPVTFTPGGAR